MRKKEWRLNGVRFLQVRWGREGETNIAPRRSKTAPRGLKTIPRGPKTAPRGSNIAPRQPQEASRRSQEAPKPLEEAPTSHLTPSRETRGLFDTQQLS